MFGRKARQIKALKAELYEGENLCAALVSRVGELERRLEASEYEEPPRRGSGKSSRFSSERFVEEQAD